MEQIVFLVIVLALAGAGALFRRYLEKVQREQEEARREQSPGPGQGQTLSGRPPTFYGRPQATAAAPAEDAALPHATAAPVVRPAQPALPVPSASQYESERPGAMRPTPIRGTPRRPAPQHPAHRQAARRPAQPSAAQAPAEEAPAPPLEQVGALGARHLHGLDAHKVSSLVGHRLDTGHMEAGIVGEVELKVVEEPSAHRGFLGNLLAPRNLARAFVMSEIFGPPKALQ